MENQCQPLALWERFFEIAEMTWVLFDRGRQIVATNGDDLFFYEQSYALVYCINLGATL